MDDAENNKPEVNEEVESAAKAAAREAADDVKAGAQETLNQVKSIRFKDFLNFDKMVFPRIATILFYIFCFLLILSGLFGVIGCLAAILKGQILGALIGVVMTVVATIVFILLTRIWFEVVLVAFKINEGVQDIRDMMKQSR